MIQYDNTNGRVCVRGEVESVREGERVMSVSPFPFLIILDLNP